MSSKKKKISKMTEKERFEEIAEIIEEVDMRCMEVDGPVTPTLKEMTQEEIRRIYKLAVGKDKIE